LTYPPLIIQRGLASDSYHAHKKRPHTSKHKPGIKHLPTEPLKIIGWGWYYLSTILDDFSRFIVAWRFGPTKHTTDVTTTLENARAFAELDHAAQRPKYFPIQEPHTSPAISPAASKSAPSLISPTRRSIRRRKARSNAGIKH